MDALDELVRMGRYELARHETLGAATQLVAWMSYMRRSATSTTSGMVLTPVQCYHGNQYSGSMLLWMVVRSTSSNMEMPRICATPDLRI